ncbi:CubicO group peptidase (beta-lactamase class C family) [Maribacter vaceletii]|uniref:CubicO group peptidase (Beta-lactamase class C family) n=1 Tax=Maribacter vaceletii TaxID=1206816 RepID=A0A495E814_9FLAO|nr:serine hydrolase domain-containing protein [Maribacter vaceletii]RKR13080.1 CubicO group peptidase (beta-lactamase class C family) [Maribacter vaceletii]
MNLFNQKIKNSSKHKERKKLHLFKLAFLLCITAFVASCSSDDNNIEPPRPEGITTTKQLATYLENIVNTTEVPGFSVNVSVENEVVFQESFGYANIANQTPYTNQTINNMASVSKTFVGAATAKAIEQGYFTLETEINDLLPIAISNPKMPNGSIKIKHLVTHTSGIVDVPETYIATNYYILPGEDITTNIGSILVNELGMQQMEQVELDAYLVEIFDEDGDLYNLDNYLEVLPGETWAYSNDATSLMGYIIAYVSGESFDAYVENYILNPLQMQNSTFNLESVDFQNAATQYYDTNEAFPIYGNHGYVEGGFYSTSDDMSHYLLDMMKGARGESSVLFSSEYYELLFTEQLADGVVPNAFAENHGLFWYMKDGNLMHGGNSLGVSTHIQLKQDGSSGFFIISNMDGTFTGNEVKWEEVKSLITEGIEEYISNNS